MNEIPLRVLIAEDNAADADLIVHELRRAGFDPEWERVDTEAAFLAQLESKPDVVLCDSSMPQFSGGRALDLMQANGLEVPFIIVSGTIGEEMAVAAMKQGAADYLLKDRLTRLGAAVAGGLEESRLRREGALADEAMRQSEHKYRHVFNSLGEAAFLIDRGAHRIVDCNPCAERLLGMSRAEILGMREARLFPEGAEAMPEEAGLREAVVLTNAGAAIAVEIGLTPLELYGRHLQLALISDITARKEVEQRLHHARDAAVEASREKSELLANVSHEIRNPVSGLIGILDLLLDEETAPKRREWIRIARASADSLLTLLREMLALSSLDARKARETEVEFSLEECLYLHLHAPAREAAARGLELRWEVAPNVPRVLLGDERRLAQVIVNLVGNALKFTERGEITVTASVEALLPGVAALNFVVRDTGIGIAPALQEVIFRQFFQADAASFERGAGVGLGLAIVRRSIEIMGGRIRVESAPGQGSAFHFTVAFRIGEGALLLVGSPPA